MDPPSREAILCSHGSICWDSPTPLVSAPPIITICTKDHAQILGNEGSDRPLWNCIKDFNFGRRTHLGIPINNFHTEYVPHGRQAVVPTTSTPC